MKISTAKSSGKLKDRVLTGTKSATLNPQRDEQGILLIECIVYIGVFFLILGIAFKLFYSCWDTARGFRRNTDEIVSTLKTGERWRADVRTATAPLHAEVSPTGSVLHIPQRSGEIGYLFSESALWRRTGTNLEWTRLLSGVKSSRMAPDQRQQVAAWRWEVELAAHGKETRVIPLFTFEAVPPRK